MPHGDILTIVSREIAETDKRTETGEVYFLTYTPNTIRQIYQDKWQVRPRKISGQLHLPSGPGPFPAVVILHGNFHPDELEPWFEDLIPQMIKAEIAIFVVDSFTGRGIPGTTRNPAILSRAARLVDAFMALRFLASLPEIDEEKIGISGYASGGTIAMISSDTRIIDAGIARGRGFAAHLPVYPDCQPQFRTLKFSESPMLFLVGELDDYTPAQYCFDYVERMNEEGFNANIKSYINAYHTWINDYKVFECEKCATLGDCGIMYIEDNGHESALDGKVTTQFSWEEYVENIYQQCGRSKTTLSLNADARKETLETTIRFFASILKTKN